MHAIHSLARSRRAIVVLACTAAAVLLTFALVVEPPTRGRGDSSSGSTVGATPSSDVSGASLDAALSDAAAPAARELGAPADASIGASPDAATTGTTPEMAGGTGSIVDVAPAGSIADVAPAGGSLRPVELDAKIVRNGRIELRTKRAGFEDAWSDVQAAANANGGYVVAASRSGAGDGPRAGTISMRVPTGRFDAAVDRLRDTAGTSVRGLDVVSQDVTQEFVDVRSRLRHDRAVEARLLLLLGQTRGVGEVLAVQGRLDQVQEQVELNRGRLDYLGKMTSMSTIDVELRAPAARGTDAADDRERSVLGESLGDARERLEGNVAGAIVWFGGALPMLVLLGALAVVARILLRRRETDAEQGIRE